MEHKSCCASKKETPDYFFWITFIISLTGYFLYISNLEFIKNISYLNSFNESIYNIMNQMWWGLVAGIAFVAIIGLVPKQVMGQLLGTSKGIKGIFRAAIAGIVLDLCSHGILLVAMKLYKKGVSLPQVIAFLVASPWNSLSLTFILWAMVGLKWTITFILLSFVIAILSGIIYKVLISKKILPENPNSIELDDNFSIKEAFKIEYEGKKIDLHFVIKTIRDTFVESQMILRWVFIGLIIASAMRTFVPTETFSVYFGATILGLIFTMVVATILEICSEGSVPIAADILNRALAPGNAFAFLMVGVATDYTEIMALKETTGSWKASLFLPLVTVPQVVILSYILNNI